MKKEKTQGEFTESLCCAQSLFVWCLTDHNILGPEVATIPVKHHLLQMAISPILGLLPLPK